MKRIISLALAICMAVLFVTGCSVNVDRNFLNTDFSFDASSGISTEFGNTGSVGKHDISDAAVNIAEDTVEEDGVYTTPAMVAAYIHMFNKLPSNYITKKEAQKLGWDAGKGNLASVAPGKSIGGDTFGNREGILPKGKYRECDVNYESGKRGSERIVYSSDGDIYYTADHYNTFEQIY